ncbi:MAG: hypothetical protein AM1032_000167 [Mycoplasmataceae bacterium]|nr:MAG: hypothetical protein AM1032_000167 [Mycoplasmataceae bacterium]
MIDISSVSDNKEKIVSSLNGEEGYQIFWLKDSESGWNYFSKSFFFENCACCSKNLLLNSYEKHVLQYDCHYSFHKGKKPVPVRVSYIQNIYCFSVLTKIDIINNNLFSSPVEKKQSVCFLKISYDLLENLNPITINLFDSFKFDNSDKFYSNLGLIGLSYPKKKSFNLNLIIKNDINVVNINCDYIEKSEDIENNKKHTNVDNVVNNEFFLFSKYFFIISVLTIFIFFVWKFLLFIYRKLFFINR